MNRSLSSSSLATTRYRTPVESQHPKRMVCLDGFEPFSANIEAVKILSHVAKKFEVHVELCEYDRSGAISLRESPKSWGERSKYTQKYNELVRLGKDRLKHVDLTWFNPNTEKVLCKTSGRNLPNPHSPSERRLPRIGSFEVILLIMGPRNEETEVLVYSKLFSEQWPRIDQVLGHIEYLVATPKAEHRLLNSSNGHNSLLQQLHLQHDPELDSEQALSLWEAASKRFAAEDFESHLAAESQFSGQLDQLESAILKADNAVVKALRAMGMVIAEQTARRESMAAAAADLMAERARFASEQAVKRERDGTVPDGTTVAEGVLTVQLELLESTIQNLRSSVQRALLTAECAEGRNARLRLKAAADLAEMIVEARMLSKGAEEVWLAFEDLNASQVGLLEPAVIRADTAMRKALKAAQTAHVKQLALLQAAAENAAAASGSARATNHAHADLKKRVSKLQQGVLLSVEFLAAEFLAVRNEVADAADELELLCTTRAPPPASVQDMEPLPDKAFDSWLSLETQGGEQAGILWEAAGGFEAPSVVEKIYHLEGELAAVSRRCRTLEQGVREHGASLAAHLAAAQSQVDACHHGFLAYAAQDRAATMRFRAELAAVEQALALSRAGEAAAAEQAARAEGLLTVQLELLESNIQNLRSSVQRALLTAECAEGRNARLRLKAAADLAEMIVEARMLSKGAEEVWLAWEDLNASQLGLIEPAVIRADTAMRKALKAAQTAHVKQLMLLQAAAENAAAASGSARATNHAHADLKKRVRKLQQGVLFSVEFLAAEFLAVRNEVADAADELELLCTTRTPPPASVQDMEPLPDKAFDSWLSLETQGGEQAGILWEAAGGFEAPSVVEKIYHLEGELAAVSRRCRTLEQGVREHGASLAAHLAAAQSQVDACHHGFLAYAAQDRAATMRFRAELAAVEQALALSRAGEAAAAEQAARAEASLKDMLAVAANAHESQAELVARLDLARSAAMLLCAEVVGATGPTMDARGILPRSLQERRQVTPRVEHVEPCLCSPGEGGEGRKACSPRRLIRPLPPELPEGANAWPLGQRRWLLAGGGGTRQGLDSDEAGELPVQDVNDAANCYPAL